MTQTYRTNDPARWGTGQGFNLSPAQVDNNFWDLIQRMLAQEGRVIPPGISYFSITGNLMYVHLSDGSILGPYELPVATFNDRGVWAPGVVYSVMDTFSINGGLYVVILAHTSAATFDPGANDGAGHDYYSLMLQTPGSVLPTGGVLNQVLAKSDTDTDYAVMWSYRLPIGGTTGQTIIKQNSAPDNAIWGDLDASDIEFTPVTGSTLTSTSVDEALEDLAARVDTPPDLSAENIAYVPPTGGTSFNVQDAIDELAAEIDDKPDAATVIGRQTMWVPAMAMIPQTTQGATPGNVELATNRIMAVTLDFNATTPEFAQFTVAFPKSWDNGYIYFQPFWSHPDVIASVWSVTWSLEAVTIGNNSPLDQALGGSLVIVNDTGGAQNTLYVGAESPRLTINGSSGPDHLVWFRVSRFANDTADNLAVDARLHGVKIFYTTTAATDN